MPKAADFSRAELPFDVNGKPQNVVDELRLALSELRVQTFVEIEGRESFVITAYALEPITEGARRIRRTAYLFRVHPETAGSQCSRVGLKWLAQSRGIHEEIWQTMQEDIEYQSSKQDAFSNMLKKMKCKL